MEFRHRWWYFGALDRSEETPSDLSESDAPCPRNNAGAGSCE
jgi:hypothetical protein